MSSLDEHLLRMASTGSVGNVFDEWSEFISYVRNLEAENAKLTAKVGELEAIIDAAPHERHCIEGIEDFHTEEILKCNCWKSEEPQGVEATQ